MRCPRCGNENSEENRFCGMCGTKLLSTPAVLAPTPVGVASSPAQAPSIRTSTPTSAAAPAASRPQFGTAPRPAAQGYEDSPVISGPSFLGLSDPAPRNPASLSADPHPGSGSSNLDYLLDDEGEPRRSGGGKLALVLLVLALAVGYGYLRVKVLNQGPSKPPAAAQNSDPTDTTSTAAAPAPTPSTPPIAAAAQPAPEAAKPAENPPSATRPPSDNPAATPDNGNSPASTATDAGDTAASSAASNSSPDSAPAPVPAAKEPTPVPPTAPSPKPKRAAAVPTTPKPRAGIPPTSSADPVSAAQKYIYGRGVGQDCERGMRLLKPAAAQANPKAMIEMGALYSAGLCTPHDLPTAYRWFAMALRKDPENQSVQKDLQKLWGEMTQPERQLAIKLSQ